MNDRYVFEELTNEEYYEILLMDGDISKNDNLAKNDYFCLEERDFYPPHDNRILKSYIKDVHGGDNFMDYCEYIFDLYEEENYYE